MRSKTLGWREVSSWRRSFRIADCGLRNCGIAELRNCGIDCVFQSAIRIPQSDILDADAVFAFGVAGERVLRRLRAGNDLADGRLAGERALDRLARRLVVEVVDLLIACRFPVDEHA